MNNDEHPGIRKVSYKGVKIIPAEKEDAPLRIASEFIENTKNEDVPLGNSLDENLSPARLVPGEQRVSLMSAEYKNKEIGERKDGSGFFGETPAEYKNFDYKDLSIKRPEGP